MSISYELVLHELAPCPHCGEIPYDVSIMQLEPGWFTASFLCCCSEKFSIQPLGYGETEDQAISNLVNGWNKRVL